MANQKKPFHEVLSTQIHEVSLGMSSDHASLKAGQMEAVLIVLLKGKMPASAAHQIAEDHTGLPVFLVKAGHVGLSVFAEEVLADLKGREDEKKEKVEEESFVFPL